MTLHDDRTFVRHFSWVILFLAVMLLIFIFLSFLIVGATGVEDHSGYSYVQYMNQHPGAAAAAATAAGSEAQATTAQGNTAPQEVVATGEAKSAAGSGEAKASGAVNGAAVWQAHCGVCHATGVAGAPKIGDQAVWGPILKETDMATLYDHAINGYSGDLGFMPPRGGNPGLSDAEVKAAVDYMVEKSGGSPN